jgi:hypothetical protein
MTLNETFGEVEVVAVVVSEMKIPGYLVVEETVMEAGQEELEQGIHYFVDGLMIGQRVAAEEGEE